MKRLFHTEKKPKKLTYKDAENHHLRWDCDGANLHLRLHSSMPERHNTNELEKALEYLKSFPKANKNQLASGGHIADEIWGGKPYDWKTHTQLVKQIENELGERR